MYMHPMITLIPYTCMHVHICIIVYACVKVCVYVYVYMYVCVCVCVWGRERICFLFILCMDTCMSAYVFVGICICIYLCLFICIHVSIYMCVELVGRVYSSLNFTYLYLRSHWYMMMLVCGCLRICIHYIELFIFVWATLHFIYIYI